ncbi:PREDICTED: transcription elongation factor B polypeptide 3-like [Calidris pugnax]|uniref:transcription elongation factor B polypeptide 3-like n=1 Tax=Calidris pugnax TaxID=198806 RepID=UPI00071E2680|nr:PREDICTED: transcription elongation factor B polypeptide 3-like [Calidris pugnax]
MMEAGKRPGGGRRGVLWEGAARAAAPLAAGGRSGAAAGCRGNRGRAAAILSPGPFEIRVGGSSRPCPPSHPGAGSRARPAPPCAAASVRRALGQTLAERDGVLSGTAAEACRDELQSFCWEMLHQKEPALGNAVTELDADFEASFQAAWQKLEQLCEEAVRDNKCAEKEKCRDSERGKVEKTKRSLETSTKGRQEGSSKSDSSKKTKEKGISGSFSSSERKRKFSHVAKRSTGFPSLLGEDEKEEKFPLPTMSFEEYLNYDQPQKKKVKRAVRASVSAGKEEHPRVDSSCSCQPSPSRKRSHEQRGEQEPPEAPEPKRILLNVDIKLPEIPLPPIQARCSPLPAAESPPCPQKKRRAAPSAAEEPEGGFPGCRVYSKTPVFSGLNTARVPRAPSQQPVPGVTNNTACKYLSSSTGNRGKWSLVQALLHWERLPSVKRVVSLWWSQRWGDAPQSSFVARRDVTM